MTVTAPPKREIKAGASPIQIQEMSKDKAGVA